MVKNSLQRDFALREDFFSNRSSAIFPIYFRSKKNDLILSWLNYWTIKNNIDENSISINVRIYTNDGILVTRKRLILEHTTNSLSVRSLLLEEQFEGMVEIEIISTENIRYSFPAIMGFYKTGSLYSCVHSAGRYKGSDENQSESRTEETNWNCKFNNDVTPFFHYVNGSADTELRLKIYLKTEKGMTISTAFIHDKMRAFGSKIYFIDEIIKNTKFDDSMFIGVECNNNSVFRRMVVGNYHKSLQHMEVTHSFQKQELRDYCPKNDFGAESLLSLYSDSNLSLTARIFPTNCDGQFLVKESSQIYNSTTLGEPKDTSLISNGYGLIELERGVQLKVLWLYGETVPSRLNCSFSYKVKNCDSRFSTDIATGAKSSVYPPKYSHWGSGVYGNGYDFVLLVRNLNHNLDALDAKGTLSVFGLAFDFQTELELRGNSSISVLLSGLLPKDRSGVFLEREVIFTWFLKLDKPTSETFWISFRRRDGCVLGDHGF